MAIVGATSEVVILKQALVEAEKRAATERTEREKYEAEDWQGAARASGSHGKT